MALNIVQLRRMIFVPMGADTDNDVELPRDQIDLYLNRAYWEVQDKFPFREKEVVAEFETQNGVIRYDMPEPFEALKGLSVVDNAGQHHELRQIEMNEYEKIYREGEDHHGMPQKYVRIGCYAQLWPTPGSGPSANANWKMIIKRLVTLADLSLSNAFPDLPQVWHEIIGYGGLWRAYWDIGDQQRAANTKRLQESLLNSLVPTQAKEEGVDTRYAHLEVIRNPYGW